MVKIPEHVCGVSLRKLLDDAEILGASDIVAGICEGRILSQRRGSGGFGYDPVFHIPEAGKTFAEMSLTEKQRISHRGHAMRKACVILEEWLRTSGKR